MDSRQSLVHQNILMKNTLIRALNRINELAPLIPSSHPSFLPFLNYVGFSVDMLLLHLEGDATFFGSPNVNGKSLQSYLGPNSNPPTVWLQDNLKDLRKELRGWNEAPGEYTAKILQENLTFGPKWVALIEKQAESMSADRLTEAISDDELRALIKDNIQWLAGNSDISVLLPFVVSHHDPITSKYWPALTPEGQAGLSDIAQLHSECWAFAPFYITGELRTWSV